MKKTILLLSVMVLSLTAMSQQAPPKNIIVSLPAEGWQIVMKALGKLPLEESAVVYSMINQQASAQIQPQPVVADSTKVKPKEKK